MVLSSLLCLNETLKKHIDLTIEKVAVYCSPFVECCTQIGDIVPSVEPQPVQQVQSELIKVQVQIRGNVEYSEEYPTSFFCWLGLAPG